MVQPTIDVQQAVQQSVNKELTQIDWTAIVLATIKNLLAFWQIWLFLGILVVIKLAWQFYEYQKLSKAGIFEIDKMNGTEFEERLKILFENFGFAVTRTGGRPGGDYGVDLTIEKDGERTAIQAKCYKHTKVGEDAIREVNTGKTMYHCYKAQVITNSKYTPMAWSLARANHVWLYDRNGLIKLLLMERDIKNKKQNIESAR